MLVILEHPRGARILLRARVSDFRRRSRGGASFVASVAGLQPPPSLSLPRRSWTRGQTGVREAGVGGAAAALPC